jgi:hypothetical protein
VPPDEDVSCQARYATQQSAPIPALSHIAAYLIDLDVPWFVGEERIVERAYRAGWSDAKIACTCKHGA